MKTSLRESGTGEFKHISEFCIWLENYLTGMPDPLGSVYLAIKLQSFCPEDAWVSARTTHPQVCDIDVVDSSGGRDIIVFESRCLGGKWQYMENDFRETERNE